MPRYRIVIDDADKAHEAHIRSYERGLAGSAPRPLHLVKHHRSIAERHAGTPRPVGTVHAEMEDTCPLELPNCRQCGDPQYVVECRAAGHCPDCGTKHGIAPESVLVRSGYALELVTE